MISIFVFFVVQIIFVGRGFALATQLGRVGRYAFETISVAGLGTELARFALWRLILEMRRHGDVAELFLLGGCQGGHGDAEGALTGLRAARLVGTRVVEESTVEEINVRTVLRLRPPVWSGTVLKGLRWERGGRNVPVVGKEVQLVQGIAVVGPQRRGELALVGPGGVLVEACEGQVGARRGDGI